MERWLSGRGIWLSTFLLLGLLLLLAALQTRWMNQIMEAQRDRLDQSVHASARRFGGAFLEEFIRLFWAFESSYDRGGRMDASAIRNAHRLWAETAIAPELVKSVFYLRSPDESDRAVQYRLDTRSVDDVVLPAEVQQALEKARDRFAFRPPFDQAGLPLFDRYLVVPDFTWRRTGPNRTARRGRRGGNQRSRIVLELDLAVLGQRLFPELVADYFPEAAELDIVVSTRDGERVLYRSSEASNQFFENVDVAVPLGDPRAFLERGSGRARRPPGTRPSVRAGQPPPDREDARRNEVGGPPNPRRFLPRPDDGPEGDGMFILVRHRQGSFAQAVRTVRNRNLGVSFGILALMAFSVLLVAQASRRLVSLSNQKMEFVAGVSHELRTPLAVIRSAAQNLSQGTVTESDRIREYGALIEREGVRLNGLVDQVLEYAGIQSGARTFHARAFAFGPWFDEVVGAAEEILRETEMELTATSEYRGSLTADPDALRRAVLNLVTNGINHASDGRVLDLRAILKRSSSSSSPEKAGELHLSVTDRGRGIPSDELSKVFEPFVRGARARDDQVRGSGLGLTIVRRTLEAMGGRVEVESPREGGAKFTLILPVTLLESAHSAEDSKR